MGCVVWVQVPLPALFVKPRKSKIFSKIKGLRGFSLLTIFQKIKEIWAFLRKKVPKKVPKILTQSLYILAGKFHHISLLIRLSMTVYPLHDIVRTPATGTHDVTVRYAK